MTANRLKNGILEWPEATDQYVVLVSRRVQCTEDQLDAAMTAYIQRHRDQDGDPTRLDENELAGELSGRLGRKVSVSSWQNPAGMIEYYVELEGQHVDWQWFDE